MSPSGEHRLWLGGWFDGSPDPLVDVTWEAGGRRGQWHGLEVTWRRVRAAGLGIWMGIAELPPLTSILHRITAVTHHGSTIATNISLVGFPTEIPPVGDNHSFRVVLSSCFARDQDNGKLGETLQVLQQRSLPHLKILCGDQLYLDQPVLQNLSDDQVVLADQLAHKYWTSWSDESFASYLRWGANAFISDDHEFWNNYPYATGIAENTWSESGRAQWGNVATDLFVGFQTCARAKEQVQPYRLVVGNRSRIDVFALDGRLFRTRDKAHDPQHLAQAVEWIGRLSCPGVLVLSQPLFERSRGWFAQRVTDAHIQDLDDYPCLARALYRAQHDILVLSGDIHGGRVARAEFPSARVYEIVSSPTALVRGSPYHRHRADKTFPAQRIRDVAQVQVTSTEPIQYDHIAILSFQSVGPQIKVDVEFRSLDPRHASVRYDKTIRLR